MIFLPIPTIISKEFMTLEAPEQTLREKAKLNLQRIQRSTPNFGIFLGQTESQGKDVQVILQEQGHTQVYRRHKSGVWAVNPENDNGLYIAMMGYSNDHLVANGNHIEKLIQDYVLSDRTLESSLREVSPGIDNTPRVAGVTSRVGSLVVNRFSQIFSSYGNLNRTTENNPSHWPGYGEVVRAHIGNRSSEPRSPFTIPFEGNTASDVADYFWQLLDPESATAVVAKTIDRRTGM